MTRSKAQEYREVARECRKLAGTVSTDEGRAHLIAMAEVWERLVAQQEQRGSDLSEATAPPSPGGEQPVVQQQQQVQPKDENKDD